VRERVRPGADRLRASGVEDLRLDDARVAVVDGAHHRDRAAVLARVAHEELPLALGLGAHRASVAAFSAACATVSRSAKPLKRTNKLPGRSKISTAGPSSTRSAGVGAAVSSELRGETTFSSATLKETKPAFASEAPWCASAVAIVSTLAPGV